MKKLLESVGLTEQEIESVIKKMESADLNSVEVLKECTVKELQSELGLTLGKAKILKSKVEAYKSSEVEEVFTLPNLPQTLNSLKFEVTGNSTLNVENVIKYIQFGVLYAMDTESIGKKLYELVKRREDELDEPNPETITNLNLLLAKFNDIDTTLALSLNTSLGFFSQRHSIYAEIQNNLVPNCIKLIADILQFRVDLADIDSFIIGKTLGVQKISNDVSLSNIILAGEEFTIKVNRDLRGDNLLIIEESMKLYKKLFDILDDVELQQYIGAKDKRDLFLRLGISLTPKDIASMQELPTIIYQFLHCIESDKFQDSKILLSYLQKVWQNAKNIDWSKFGKPKSLGLSNVKTYTQDLKKVLSTTEEF